MIRASASIINPILLAAVITITVLPIPGRLTKRGMPNGALLIYATRDRGRGVLATVSVDGSVQQRLAGGEGDIREPAWSPLLK